MQKKLIISIGTGRCGSVSLSKFLSAQRSVQMLHEGRLDSHKLRKLIKWNNDEEELLSWLNFLLKQENNNEYTGDTGMYFLPYIDLIIKKHPNVRVIVMVRDKKEVVKSYLKKTEGRNHWFKHDGEKWDFDDKWDPCYPKYNIENKEEALEKYWDEYLQETNNLSKKYPENIKIWTIQDLNSEDGKNNILDFLNYKNQRSIDKEFKHNTKLKSQKESIINKIKKWF